MVVVLLQIIKKSTIDLSGYGVGYKLIDFSCGDSSITGVNFVNYNRYDHDESKMSNRDKMNDALINLGTYRNPTYQSSLINCTFENITLGDINMIVRMAFKSNPLNSSEKIMSGGKVENCTFINNNASQMLVIGGAVIDSAHSDECPVFYGFNATNNKFINNVGRAKYDSTLMSLGLAFKLWNEAVNVTLHNNVFINNINAVHGAAYCIIGTNVTITNNYVEANRLFTVQVLKLIMVTLLLKIQYLLTICFR